MEKFLLDLVENALCVGFSGNFKFRLEDYDILNIFFTVYVVDIYSSDSFYLLFEIVRPPVGVEDSYPIAHLIRKFNKKSSAHRAFFALSELE